MFTSMMLAPPRTWSRATSTAVAYFPCLIRLAKRREPVTFVRSPISVKFESGRIA
jgi:hypothetical protein